ncbi:Nucleolar protein 4-like [Saguinus oedipus]|uniref:Nucleolar protein 4-like n=1 Tax=Saguinus oedipus TaxID=9490 RepID=A0ABQ9VKC0_SAGOE|nr:Nucleolar protein 4-like [Saguinus oedipus]
MPRTALPGPSAPDGPAILAEGTLGLPQLGLWAGEDTSQSLRDDSSSESGSGNGSSTLNPSTSSSTQGDPAFPEMNGNGAVAPMDFTTAAEDQPINLCDKLPPATALGTPSYPSDGCGADGLRSRVKYGVKTTPELPGFAPQSAVSLVAVPRPRCHITGSGSYDSIKTEVSGCPEDLTVGRAPTADDDDDDHDDHEDNDKMNDSEGMDPERLKAFNVSTG